MEQSLSAGVSNGSQMHQNHLQGPRAHCGALRTCTSVKFSVMLMLLVQGHTLRTSVLGHLSDLSLCSHLHPHIQQIECGKKKKILQKRIFFSFSVVKRVWLSPREELPQPCHTPPAPAGPFHYLPPSVGVRMGLSELPKC